MIIFIYPRNKVFRSDFPFTDSVNSSYKTRIIIAVNRADWVPSDLMTRKVLRRPPQSGNIRVLQPTAFDEILVYTRSQNVPDS